MWEDDRAALVYLRDRGVREIKNGILLIPYGKTLDEKDGSAIDYLVDEWDFSWEREVLKA
jgi:hypothetical protein